VGAKRWNEASTSSNRDTVRGGTTLTPVTLARLAVKFVAGWGTTDGRASHRHRHPDLRFL
jgi:hypothetical protein